MAFDYHAVRAVVHARFPVVFGARGTAPVPLAVGVFAGLVAAVPEVPRADLSRFLCAWTGRPEYQRALVAGGPRYGLDGAPAGEVSPEQVARAETILAEQEARGTPEERRRRDNRRRLEKRKAVIADVLSRRIEPPGWVLAKRGQKMLAMARRHAKRLRYKANLARRKGAAGQRSRAGLASGKDSSNSGGAEA